MPLGERMLILERRQDVFGEAQVFEVQRDVARVEHADHRLLAAAARKGADAEVDLAAVQHHVDAAVLRQAALADVQRRHDLDAAGDRAEQVLRHLQRLVQPAVDAVADSQAAFGRLDVDVAGAFLDGVDR